MLYAAVVSVLMSANPISDVYDLYLRMVLEGTATGGNLALVNHRDDPSVFYICWVRTAPGEGGARVAERFEETFIATSLGYEKCVREGSQIYLMPGWYYLVGSDTGFAAPLAPLFVSVSANDGGTMRVHWIDSGMKGSLVDIIGASGGPFPSRLETAAVSTDASSEQHGLRLAVATRINSDYYRETLLASRPTRLCVTRKKQEDLDNLPFYGNVQPNWVAWSPEGFEEGALGLSQGEKSEVPEDARKRAFAQSPDAKFYCQMFELKPGTSADGGVYRRYLGLLPGHRYRVYARFNTFEAKSDAGDWGLSFHACADPAGGGLDVEQLQGLRPLPDGASGPDAGLVTAFARGGTTTGGKWAEVKTGTDGASADITIPEGSSSLSAWVRVKGAGPARFGMDWSALEDMAP